MEELRLKAEHYAEENISKVLKEALAKAFSDGYIAGYNDSKDNLYVNLRTKKTEYVDLDLPSGTLWSSDYERDNDDISYMTYSEAGKYNIPTEAQINELIEWCEWHNDSDKKEIVVVGRNHKIIRFTRTGMISIEKVEELDRGYSWVKNEDINKNMKYFFLFDNSKSNCKGSSLRYTFSGNKLPIRLVKNKEE